MARDDAGAARDGAEQHGIQDTFDVNKEQNDCDRYEHTNQDVTKYFPCTDDIVIEQHKTATFIRGAINEFIAMPVDVPSAAPSFAPCIEGAVANDSLVTAHAAAYVVAQVGATVDASVASPCNVDLLALWVRLQ